MGEWRDDRAVVKLTDEILNLQRRLAQKVVADVVAMGRRMARVHAKLAHGEWERWIDEAVPFTPRTVGNYMMLASWADERPADIERLGHLGPTKMYLLAPLTPGVRRSLTSSRPVDIPGGGKKTVDVMTVAELGRVIQGPGGLATPPARRVPIAKVVQGVKHSIAGLDARVEELVERAREVDAGVVVELRDMLAAVVGELDAVVG